MVAGLLLSLVRIHNGVAHPVDSNGFIITHVAADHFPDTKGDLSRFNVDVRYVSYNATTQSWLTGPNPASGSTDREKATIIVEAAYAKPFDTNDPDMTKDVDSLLAAVAGNDIAIEGRGGSTFRIATSHAVKWASSAGVLSCLSDTTCTFSLDVNKAPSSQCQAQGGANCCIGWLNYNVRVGFFSATWTACDSEVDASELSSASCEGYGTRRRCLP
jgi:hypothetical protein